MQVDLGAVTEVAGVLLTEKSTGTERTVSEEQSFALTVRHTRHGVVDESEHYSQLVSLSAEQVQQTATESERLALSVVEIHSSRHVSCSNGVHVQ